MLDFVRNIVNGQIQHFWTVFSTFFLQCTCKKLRKYKNVATITDMHQINFDLMSLLTFWLEINPYNFFKLSALTTDNTVPHDHCIAC